MRTLMKIKMQDVAAANRAIQEGILPRLVQDLSKIVQPEATYFFAESGCRTALFVFDMKDSTLIPSLAEPFFMHLNAHVECTPIMNLDEMIRGVDMAMKRR
jgi:hypothetical protein